MKKMNNKGFSMVELIIVIAIMAILAGAIAPTLIKYVNKSRMSSDVSNAQTVATSIQSALANQAANDAFMSKFTSGTVNTDLDTLVGSGTGAFGTELKAILGNVPSVKYTKKPGANAKFWAEITTGGTSADKVKVYVKGTGTGATQVNLYPDVDPDYE